MAVAKIDSIAAAIAEVFEAEDRMVQDALEALAEADPFAGLDVPFTDWSE